MSQCVTCGAALGGSFCSQCGEKVLHAEHDYSVRHFVEESAEGFLHLDSRFLRTLRLLLMRPGFLTAEFVSGRRVPYMKPISMFFVVALAFYLLFPAATAFFSNPGDLSSGFQSGSRWSNTLQVDPDALVRTRAAASHQDPGTYAMKLAQEHAAPRSRAWLFMIVPAWGLALWALLGWRQKWLVPHLVFALHGLAFFMLLDLAGLGFILLLLRMRTVGDGYVYFLLAAMTLWCVLAVRRTYGLTVAVAMPLGIAAAAFFFVALGLYRQLITLWTLWGA